MKVTKEILSVLEETLNNSINEGMEKAGLLTYNPVNDTIIGIIPAEYLQNFKLNYGLELESGIDSGLLEEIKNFNSGGVDKLLIGNAIIERKNSMWKDFNHIKIIPYHIHPLDDLDIFPSREDVRYSEKFGAPAVVVGSKKARDTYKLKVPFAAAYDSNQKLRNYANVLKEAMEYEINLAYGEHHLDRPIKMLRLG